MVRTLVAMTLALGACACATAVKPPVAVVPAAPILPPPPTFAQKQSWILRLEDRRVLRDPASESTPAPAEIGAATTLPSQPPDLLRLLTDDEARIRRRAALAVGRVGLREGVPALIALLADTDPEVRQMAAFGLGLLADARAHDSLIAALVDSSPLVRGSAAEALGLIGDPSAAGAIAQMASQAIQAGPFTASVGADGDDRDTATAAFRLALSALVRLKAYDSLASVVFDASGQVRERSWPVAFALQRLEDPRALPALLALAADADPYTRAFALKGLGALGNRSAVPVILPLVSGPDRWVAIEAIRALGRLGDPATAPTLVRVIQSPKPDPTLRLEAVSALGGIAGDGVVEVLLDLVADPSPYIRAAVLRSLGQLDPQTLIPVLSGLDPDPDWRVRLALATVLGTLPPEAAVARLRSMLLDTDQRVVAAVVPAFAKLRSSDATNLLMERLKVEDAVVRAAAATAIGELKPPGGASALAEAYRAAVSDTTYVARASSLAALSKYGSADAVPTLTEALQDKDWAVRVRAAALLKELDPASDVQQQMRPAPTMLSPDVYSAERLVNPAISTQVYIETDRGTIQLELAVLEAPLTVENFVTLARQGFFDGLTLHRVVPNFVVQTGDPRGDSEGGPGFTIRDELNERAYLRGTVGMALDWADTGGSQFFITHSPQPHLDAKYTVFGRVVSGMEVVDQIQPGDVMRRVRVWDGT